jgi:cellulose synthase (UDP-forming)
VLGVRKKPETLLKKEVDKGARRSTGDGVPAIGPAPGRRGGEKTPHNSKRLTAESRITYFALVATLLATSLVLWKLGGIYSNSLRSGDIWTIIEQGVFIFLVLILIYGGIVYHLARIGYYKRLQKHRPVPRERIEASFLKHPAPPVTILVPSYKEEPRTIEQTLLSAAMQTYPNRRVVLLLDDPPHPNQSDDLEKLEAARTIAASIQAFLDHLAHPFEREMREFETRKERGKLHAGSEARHLADLYQSAATCLQSKAADYFNRDHTDDFFIDQVLLASAQDHSRRAADLRSTAVLSEPQLQLEYERLAALFRVEVTFFERKWLLNLSHEPNKAMNLNSYIDLIGRSFTVAQEPGALLLQEVSPHAPNDLFRVPEAKYVVTVDADSILTSQYVERLVYHMEQPGNERVAVAQTPYTAIPGATGRLERIAGATTDIQYLVHQGSSLFSAAYWVGANAVLRKSALEDIRAEAMERGFTTHKYIQDRTVIEDTESTIDLVERGWEVYNYPDRLAYSATPPDFGSILIQRRRWANGGLIILPKLLWYLRKSMGWRKALEGFIRVHYLISLAGVNLALLTLFVYPFEEDLSIYWLPLTAVPYFYLYARDLSLMGRRFWDVLAVYAFNLMLIPIQLGGVVKSLHQAIIGVKTPFSRTPKVSGRTVAPRFYVMTEFALLAFFLFSALMDVLLGNWLHVMVAAVNVVVFYFVVSRFMGFKASVEDIRAPQRGQRGPRRLLPRVAHQRPYLDHVRRRAAGRRGDPLPPAAHAYLVDRAPSAHNHRQ